MKKYIEKEKLIKSLWDEVNFYEEDTEYDIATGLSYAINAVENMPEEDVVEVVRCKDCIYFQDYNFFGLPVYYCMLHKEHDDYEFFTEHDNYCSFGVRKDLEN